MWNIQASTHIFYEKLFKSVKIHYLTKIINFSHFGGFSVKSDIVTRDFKLSVTI